MTYEIYFKVDYVKDKLADFIRLDGITSIVTNEKGNMIDFYQENGRVARMHVDYICNIYPLCPAETTIEGGGGREHRNGGSIDNPTQIPNGRNMTGDPADW